MTSESTSDHAVACAAEQTQFGEGPRWDARRGELLGVDILAGRVYRDRLGHDGALTPVRSYELPGTVGMIAPIQSDDGWLLGAGLAFVHLGTGSRYRSIADIAAASTVMPSGLPPMPFEIVSPSSISSVRPSRPRRWGEEFPSGSAQRRSLLRAVQGRRARGRCRGHQESPVFGRSALLDVRGSM